RRHTISDRDWSSDVCSSDLITAVPLRVLAGAVAKRLAQLVGAVARRIERDDERLVLRVDQVVGAGRSDLADLGDARRGCESDGQIGRASCRERVKRAEVGG